MAESFGHEGSGGGMVATFALMYISEDLHSFLWLYEAFVDASYTMPCELLIDNGVGVCSALDLSG